MAQAKIIDVSHWHEMRAERIGASEVAALFEAHPFMGRWTLAQIKRGEVKVEENDSMVIGNIFEPAIAAYAMKKLGITLVKCEDYFYEENGDLGCSPDYYEPATGRYVQIKSLFNKPDGDLMPEYIEFQAQVEMHCTGTDRHLTIAMDPWRKLYLFERTYDAVVCNKLSKAAHEFMDDVRTGVVPEVDEASSSDAKKFFGRMETIVQTVNKVGDSEFQSLVNDLQDFKEVRKSLDAKIEYAEARLLEELGSCDAASYDGGFVHAKTISVAGRTNVVKPYSYRRITVKGAK